jgi:uncharacterized protein (DUF433 family)
MTLDWKNCAAVESVPDRLSGAWVFHGTRIPVTVLFDNLEDGLTVQDIVALYPGLTMGHIEGVLEVVSCSLVAEANVHYAIQAAEALLPGRPSPDGEKDPRWQAIMKIEDFVESEAEAIWPFVLKWGSLPDEEDLSAAIATLLLERLLQFHFDLIFPRVEAAARSNVWFAKTFAKSWKLGQAEEAARAEQYDKLLSEIRHAREQ